MTHIAIIGGTGLYEMAGLTQVRARKISTSYGSPSSNLMQGVKAGHDIFFLSRHGVPHHIPPHKVNYRANISALKSLGVQWVIAVNAVGGIHADMLSPGHIVVPHQIVDYTYGRAHTFYDGATNQLEHVDFTEPYDKRLRQLLTQQTQALKFPVSEKGVYACTQGPRLETPAEINRLKQDGCDIVGMTGMPEASLAAEAGLAYASLCLVVNPAAGLGAGHITLADIHAALESGMKRIIQVIETVLVNFDHVFL